jgi:hypothetical protein
VPSTRLAVDALRPGGAVGGLHAQQVERGQLAVGQQRLDRGREVDAAERPEVDLGDRRELRGGQLDRQVGEGEDVQVGDAALRAGLLLVDAVGRPGGRGGGREGGAAEQRRDPDARAARRRGTARGRPAVGGDRLEGLAEDRALHRAGVAVESGRGGTG